MPTTLTIIRPYATYGLGRKVKIFVDGTEVGGVQAQEQFSFELTPGEHEVYVQQDWVKSEPLKFTIEDGTEVKYSILTPDIITSYVNVFFKAKTFYKLLPA